MLLIYLRKYLNGSYWEIVLFFHSLIKRRHLSKGWYLILLKERSILRGLYIEMVIRFNVTDVKKRNPSTVFSLYVHPKRQQNGSILVVCVLPVGKLTRSTKQWQFNFWDKCFSPNFDQYTNKVIYFPILSKNRVWRYLILHISNIQWTFFWTQVQQMTKLCEES